MTEEFRRTVASSIEKPAPACQLDDQGRRVLAGLTFAETREFEALDARIPFDGQHVWPTLGLPLLPMEQRWHELWARHAAAARSASGLSGLDLRNQPLTGARKT